MPSRRNGHLEEALATLINNQAQFIAHMATADQRFARIESELAQIRAILLRHERTLEALPEVIRDKIGFQK